MADRSIVAPGGPLVEASGVRFGYTDEPVLDGVDLGVLPGEFVALVGPNGSGKSTLLKLLLGSLRPEVGTVRLFGRDPARGCATEGELGFVPQRPSLASETPATVEEIVSSGRLVRRGWWRPLTAADRVAVGHAMESVGLGALADRPVTELSGGQQQRAFIARAFASEPQLLVLDEPIAGVDAGSQRRFRDSLVHLLREHGSGVLLVSHELAAVAEDLDRVVVLKGHVLFDGPPVGARGLGCVVGRPQRGPPPVAGGTHVIALDLPLPYPFDRSFMQDALVASLIVGVFAPMIGTFLVQKRLALIGDGIGHVAFAGVGAGLLLGVWPVWTALVFAVVGALGVEWLREHRRASGDVALALLFYSGIALGVVLVSLADGMDGTILGYLFGQPLSVTDGEIATIAALGAVIVASILVLRRSLFAVVTDEDWSRVAGLPSAGLNALLAVAAACGVVAAMRGRRPPPRGRAHGPARGEWPAARSLVPRHAPLVGRDRNGLGRGRAGVLSVLEPRSRWNHRAGRRGHLRRGGRRQADRSARAPPGGARMTRDVHTRRARTPRGGGPTLHAATTPAGRHPAECGAAPHDPRHPAGTRRHEAELRLSQPRRRWSRPAWSGGWPPTRSSAATS